LQIRFKAFKVPACSESSSYQAIYLEKDNSLYQPKRLQGKVSRASQQPNASDGKAHKKHYLH
jgi:hypothetical protein